MSILFGSLRAFCAIRMVLPVIRSRSCGGSTSTLADLLVRVWCYSG